MKRDYERIRQRVTADGEHAGRRRAVVDALWEELAAHDVSWVGFYLPDESDADALVLDASRDKPACSPIGMHGACGRSFRTHRAVIVRDVRTLGDAYIACDPRDLSEVVVPCLDDAGTCWGVLDLDSFSVGAFDARDVEGLLAVLRAARLTSDAPVPIDVC
ncbi:MAG: GAF domain-containing protein [Planctomycetota bacterium]|nr:MAG: GAF domain-containing protein [Planctomycetota bacterium]